MFYKLPKKSVPEHHQFTFLGGFCGRSGDHNFQNFFNFNPFIASHGRLSPNAKRSAAPLVSSRPESASQTRPGSSGVSHFHAQNGSSSFRSPAFSSSKRLKLVPEPRIFKLKTAQARSGAPHFHTRPGARSGARAHFSLCRGTYTKIWGEYIPPPPRGGGAYVLVPLAMPVTVVYPEFVNGAHSEGAKRPSGRRVWEGDTPSHGREIFVVEILRIKMALFAH